MMLVTSVYTVVDGLFVSNFAGSDAFAGMNLIWPAVGIVGALGLMIGSGGSALVSKTFGEGDPERANRIFSMLVILTIVGGSIIAVLMYVLMPSLTLALGADEVLAPHATQYGRILIVILPFYMLNMAFQPFFMAAEYPHFGTVISIACGVSNMLLDALFVAVFKWGLAGAALATAISLSVGGVVPLWYFSSRRNRTHLKFVLCGFDWKSIGKSCVNGMSEFVGNIAMNVIGICYNWQLMRFIGADGVSAYGIIWYIGFLFAAVFIGYNMGITQVIAYNFGAGNRYEMRSLLKKSLVFISFFGLVMTVAAEVFIPTVAGVFVGYDESLCSLTVHAARIYMFSFLICGFNMFTSAWFTALNNGMVSAVAAFVRTLVFELSVVFILPAIVGIDGIWYSVNVAEVLALILSAALIMAFSKKYGYSKASTEKENPSQNTL